MFHTLKRKYGATIVEVIAFGDDARKKLQSLESRDAELARLNAALEKVDAEILAAGKKLSAARKKVIPQLAKAAGQQLEDLGFKQSRFDVELKPLTRPSATLSPSDGRGTGRGARSFLQPASTKLNFNSRPIPASRPSRCGPLPRLEKWLA